MYRIIGTDGRPYGPVDAEQIRRWAAENRVNAQTPAQIEGGTEWKPLMEIPELAAGLKTLPPPVVPPSIYAARAANKIPAGICGIMLGSLGIHKFILGYTRAGVVMLLVTLVGGLITCGIAAWVMWIIGLIEGIIYLCKSDEEFVRVYVEGRKEWF
jgi:TM2 domain-containing membrane protein YozV